MTKNPLLITALVLTALIAAWGIFDTPGLADFASRIVALQFTSRAWFIMLAVSFMLVVSLGLAFSKYGNVVLGSDNDTPEFSTLSWLTMLFAAGMGVGLLYWGTAEPLTHFLSVKEAVGETEAAGAALFVTIFNWGLHAWAIYALTGLVMAYFSFRLGCPTLVGAPIIRVFGATPIPKAIGWVCDLLAIVAIAIGLGGSVAMGVFQVQAGVETLFGLRDTGLMLSIGIFVLLCATYFPPLLVDLGKGMAVLSNIAMIVALLLMIFVILAGPTHYIMGGIVQSIGEYFSSAFVHGFRTFTFMDTTTEDWFQSWTLTYMVWWIAWAPFVGVFIARISRGRTIRQFIIGVVFAPTIFPSSGSELLAASDSTQP